MIRACTPLRLCFPLIIFFLLSFLPAYGQPETNRVHRLIDSLKTLLLTDQPDSLRLSRMIFLSNHYSGPQATREEVQTGIALAEQAKALAEKTNDQRAVFYAVQTMAGLYEDGLDDYSTSYALWMEALETARRNQLYEEMHQAYSSLLNRYFHLGDYASAMKVAIEGMTSAEVKMDEAKVAKYTSLLGFIHLRQGNVKEAYKYYELYRTQATEMQDTLLLAEAYEYLADVSIAEKNYDASLTHRFRSLQFYTAVLQKNAHHFRRHRIPYNYAYIGLSYSMKGEYQKGLAYCLKAIDGTFPVNDYELASYYTITGNIYTALGDFHRADSLLRLGLRISLKIRHSENVRDAFMAFSQLFTRQHRYDSALAYRLRYEQLKDSIMNERSRRTIEMVQAEYQVQKKDQEILLNRQRAEQQRLITLTLAGTFIALLIILYLAYARYQLKQRNKFQQELNRKQNELFNTVTTLQDKERKRIAQDIHDQVSSLLSAAKLQLSGLEDTKGRMTGDQIKKYASAMTLMDEAVEELRTLSHNLMPATLSRLGLVAALRGMLESIAEYSGLVINFNVYGVEERLDE
jgi:two-component system, NarL family, sensor kinase